MTWTCEANVCSFSSVVEKIIGICQVWVVVSGLGREQTYTLRPYGFGALKYDIRHAALIEREKARSSTFRTQVRNTQI
jgi:hypothetical protein